MRHLSELAGIGKRLRRTGILCLIALVSSGPVANTIAAENMLNLVPDEESLHSNLVCWRHLVDYHAAVTADKMQLLDQEIEIYQGLVEQSLSYRAESVVVANRLKHKLRHHKPLSGKDLDILNQGTGAHLALRDRLYDIASAHECWLEATDNT